jgi:hypothetical protein
VDGTIRCIPNVTLIGGAWYADGACTEQALVSTAAAAPAQGALVGQELGGATSGAFQCFPAALPILARLAAPRDTATYYEKYGPSCIAREAPPGYLVYDTTPVADPLVTLTEERVAISGAIEARELRGDDGSVVFAGDLYDSGHDVAVEIRQAADGPRCLPPRAIPSPYHSTPDITACNTSDLFSAPTCGAAPPYVATDNPTEVLPVDVVTETVYQCIPGEDGVIHIASSTETVLAPRAGEPLDGWMQAPSTTSGHARLRAPGHDLSDVWLASVGSVFPITLEDISFGISCAPTVADDGALRCLPGIGAVVAYSDPACSTRIVIDTSRGSSFLRFTVEGSKPSFGFPGAAGALSVFEVGPKTSSAAYYRTPDSCVPLQGWEDVTYEIGNAVPASSFTRLELQNDP